ncbi:MAG: hypothetical protein JWN14_4256, partial [Chthonomonadales bacterium]|nr:hypothetical protein [Chthonomonadales bacterium]
MDEKPQKRIVSKGLYFKALLQKGGLYTTAIPVGCFGVGVLVSDAYFIANGLAHWNGEIGMLLFLMVYGIIQGGIGLAALWYSKVAFKAVKKMEAIAPITRHNTGFLPTQETLVRASTQPPVQQPAELLRAAQYGKETPAEELLRAGEES